MHLAIFLYLSSNDQYAFGNNFYWYLFTRNKTSAYLIDKILIICHLIGLEITSQKPATEVT